MLQALGIIKKYNDDVILDGVDITIKAGEISGIIGNSGCGKTTLLQILGLIDKPDSGTISFKNTLIQSTEQISNLLRNSISFIYQLHHLLPEFSVLENVIIPQKIANIPDDLAYKNSVEVLTKLGLKDKLQNKPHMLSGGERQRVAIARAIAKKPKIIFADEPTGNLDPENAQKAFDLMSNIAREYNITMLYVTHNHDFIKNFDNCYTIKNKKIIQITK